MLKSYQHTSPSPFLRPLHCKLLNIWRYWRHFRYVFIFSRVWVARPRLCPLPPPPPHPPLLLSCLPPRLPQALTPLCIVGIVGAVSSHALKQRSRPGCHVIVFAFCFP